MCVWVTRRTRGKEARGNFRLTLVEDDSQGFTLKAFTQKKTKFEQELLATIVLSGIVQKVCVCVCVCVC